MVRLIMFMVFAIISTYLSAQPDSSKWQGHLSIGHHSVSFLTPNFEKLHLGWQGGILTTLNRHPKHQFVASGNLAYFYHQDVQHAIQLYTEVGYQYQFDNGLAIKPLSLGGGYVLSILDATTLAWNPDTQTYTPVRFPARHNWLISLGSSVSYDSAVKFMQRPITFFTDYRLQLQGVFVQETIPFAIYIPVRLGIAVPLSISNE